MHIGLSPKERRRLVQVVKRERDARVVKRAQALLWLEEGEAAKAVAQRLQVSRQTVYNWVERFDERRNEPMVQRLQDRPRPGRPPTARQVVAEVIEEVMGTDPRQKGYASPVWTVALLRHYCQRERGVTVSQRTVRRALRGLRYRYKRPRYVLARRSATWRQVKGGSSEG